MNTTHEAFPSEDDEPDTRLDSIWELDMTADQSVFEEGDSTWSEESVLD